MLDFFSRTPAPLPPSSGMNSTPAPKQRLPSSFALTWGDVAQPDALPPLLVGGNENNAGFLEGRLNLPEGIRRASDIWGSFDPLYGRKTNLCQYSKLPLA